MSGINKPMNFGENCRSICGDMAHTREACQAEQKSDAGQKVALSLGFPGSSAGKKSTCNAGDPGLIPGSGRSPGEGTGSPPQSSWTSMVAQTVKNLLATWETPWRRVWQPTPVFFPEYSPWTEEPGGLQSVRLQRVRHDWATKPKSLIRS